MIAKIPQTNNVAAKNFRRGSEGAAEGGCGGNSAAFLQKIEAKPAALLVQSRTQQKSFLFLLEEKIGRAQNQKCRENFFAGWRASASDGGAERQFRSKKVRAFSNKAHQTGLPDFLWWEAEVCSPRRTARRGEYS